MEKGYVIPKKFRDTVVRHIYRNAIAERTDWNVPLILLISGPTGVGKSFQTLKILTELGASIHEMSGAEFESHKAGVPAKQILNRYQTASLDYDKGKQPVLVIDDADSVLGNWGEMVQYTVNTQMINKTIIDIADNPKAVHKLKGEEFGQVSLEKNSVHRVPIIMTCNDSSKFYKPLLRPGRTTTFIWNPSAEDVKTIVGGMFPDLSTEECSDIIDTIYAYAKEVDAEKYEYGVPLSVFTDTKALLQDPSIDAIIAKYSLKDLFNIDVGKVVKSSEDFSKDAIVETAKSLILKDVNFVE